MVGVKKPYFGLAGKDNEIAAHLTVDIVQKYQPNVSIPQGTSLKIYWEVMEKNSNWWIELAIIIIVFVIGLIGNIFVLIEDSSRNICDQPSHCWFGFCLFRLIRCILRKFDITSDAFNCRFNLTAVTALRLQCRAIYHHFHGDAMMPY